MAARKEDRVMGPRSWGRSRLWPDFNLILMVAAFVPKLEVRRG